MAATNGFIATEKAPIFPPEGQPILPVGFLTARHEERVLALLLDAIDTHGLLISATASIANRLDQQTSHYLSQSSLLAYMPEEPDLSVELSRQLIGSALSSACLADLQEFHSRLATARCMTLAFCRYPDGERHKGGVHIEVLSGVWRDLCEHTIAVVRALRLATHEMDRRSWSSFRSTALLSACANGRSPCILDDGTVEIKGWIERRRHARWTVDWTVRLLNGPDTAIAQIINISLSGFALVTKEPLRVSEQICVAFRNGERLSGTVQWVRGDQYGIQFATPMHFTDPIAAAARSDDGGR